MAEQVKAAGIGGRVTIKPVTTKDLAEAVLEALGGWAGNRTGPR
jgi:hypothetical protein